MALTSLASQLKRLETPQTTLLVHRLKKPSFLFDAKEAATFDRDTFYEIGISGLEELKKLNPQFAAFEFTLFDLASKGLERAVQTVDVNEKLNQNIKSFLLLLSPYFLLKSAHKALEWLVNRFHIQEFNVDELLMLALPYHETMTFARLLQIISLNSNTYQRWNWLEPVKKSGVPLSKQALLNRAATDLAFFKFVCDLPGKAIKVEGNKASSRLGTLFAFYCSTVVGALEVAAQRKISKSMTGNGITEVHVSHLMPSLVGAISSSHPDYSASAYIILAVLVANVKLSSSFVENMFNRISKVDHMRLRSETCLILCILTQNSDMKVAPEKATKKISQAVWFPSALQHWSNKGVVTTPLVSALLATAVKLVQNDSTVDSGNKESSHGSSEENDYASSMRKFIENLLSLNYKEQDALHVLRCLLKNMVKPTEWFKKIILSFEVRYSTAFDSLCCEAFKKDKDNTYQDPTVAKSLSSLLGIGVSRSEIIMNLVHPSAAIRLSALTFIAQNYPKDQMRWVANAVVSRLEDDVIDIVKAALNCKDALAECSDVSITQAAIQCIIKLYSQDCIDFVMKDVVTLLLNRCPESELAAALLTVLPLAFKSPQIFMSTVLPHPSLSDVEIFKEISTGEKLSRHKLYTCLWDIIKSGKWPPIGVPLVKKSVGESSVVKKEVTIQMDIDTPSNEFGLISDDCDDLRPIKLSQSSGTRNQTCLFDLKTLFSIHPIYWTMSLVVYAAVPSVHNQLQFADYLNSSKFTDDCEIMPSDDDKEYKIFHKWMNGTFLLKKLHPVGPALYFLIKYFAQSSSSDKDIAVWYDPSSQIQAVKAFNLAMGSLNKDSHKLMFFKPLYRVIKCFLETTFKSHEERLTFVLSTSLCLSLNRDDVSLHLINSLIKEGGSELAVATLSDENVVPLLMCHLKSKSDIIREMTLKIIKRLVSSLPECEIGSKSEFEILCSKILEENVEITLDSEQIVVFAYKHLSPDKCVESVLEKDIRGPMAKCRKAFLSIISASNPAPSFIKARILQLFECVYCEEMGGPEILSTLKKLIGNKMILDSNQSLIVRELLKKLCHPVCYPNWVTGSPNSAIIWGTLDDVLFDSSTGIEEDLDEQSSLDLQKLRSNSSPAAYLLKQLNKDLFEFLPETDQEKLIMNIINRCYDCDSGQVPNATFSFFRRINVSSKILASIIRRMSMINVEPTLVKVGKIRKSVSNIPRPEILETPDWKKGVFLLELIQTKKKFGEVSHLMVVLFDVLKCCLMFEDQSGVEYTKQLLLSLIVQCCNCLSSDKSCADSYENAISDITLQTDVVVQCIRMSHNPQTHHHALLALTSIAMIVPAEQVLHNLMDIFTFIGSTVLRQDDAYSYQIISKLVETIIPVLIKANTKNSGNRQLTPSAVGVLRVFVGAMMDVPEHRRLSLFIKLLTILGVKTHMWVFLACVLESHTRSHSSSGNASESTQSALQQAGGKDDLGSAPAETDSKRKNRVDSHIPKKLEFALQVCLEFPLEDVMMTVVELMEHTVNMPHDKEENADIILDPILTSIFDVKKSSPKQLRNYKYVLVLFISSILSSDTVVRQIVDRKDDNEQIPQAIYPRMVQASLTYVRAMTRYESFAQSSKYWKVMLTNSYGLLDKTMWLVPGDIFIDIVKKLVSKDRHETKDKSGSEGLKRKALELVGWRLSQSGNPISTDSLTSLVEPVASTSFDPQEDVVTRQTALFALKLLARHLANNDIDFFSEVLKHLTSSLSDVVNGDMEIGEGRDELMGSMILCIGELVTSLKAHSIQYLSLFMPLILNETTVHEKDVVTVSVVTGLQKVVDTLSNFLSPFLGKLLHQIVLLTAVCNPSVSSNSGATPSAQQSAPLPVNSSGTLSTRLTAIRNKLSKTVSGRILVPAVSRCYGSLIQNGEVNAVPALLTILADSFSSLDPNLSTSVISNDLSKLFLTILQFRSNCSEHNDEVELVESAAVNALTSLVLKLSETAFRPFYHSLYEWAIQSHSPGRIITFYRLSSELAQKLRGLFVLFAGIFISHATQQLSARTTGLENSTKAEGSSEQQLPLPSPLILHYILKTFLAIFTHDSFNFLTKERFDLIMPPLVSQLEVMPDEQDKPSWSYEERIDNLVAPCIAQLAASTTDDSLWKNLNYQVLLKSRHKSPQVRLASLDTVCAITRKLGEDFLPLLPETVPFLAELLEDSEEHVEKRTRETISTMEEILGEPIRKYF